MECQMIRTKYMGRLLAVSALAVVSSGVPAQTVNQSVNSSSTVYPNTQIRTMPRSTVAIAPGATVYPGTFTTRVESSGATRGMRDGALARSRASADPSATTWGAQDRNVNSPGKGYAKGKVKHEQKHKDKHKNKHKNKHKDKRD